MGVQCAGDLVRVWRLSPCLGVARIHHCAVEHAGLEGFEFGWLAAEQDERIVGIVPAFFVSCDRATTASGWLQQLMCLARRIVLNSIRLRLSFLGSPVTERCQIGLHPRSAAKNEKQFSMTFSPSGPHAHAAEASACLASRISAQADVRCVERNLAMTGDQAGTAAATACMRSAWRNGFASFVRPASVPSNRSA